MKYGRILVTILAVAAANAFATWFGPSDGTFSPDGTKVAYVSGASGDVHIYTVNADGTGKVKLELEGGLWGAPYFSPDGSKVAFINAHNFPRNANVFLVDADGKNLRQLTHYGEDRAGKSDYPRQTDCVGYPFLMFSPDGRRILYYSAEFGSKDIVSVKVDGTGKTRLTDFARYDVSEPVFLPSGEEIIFGVTGPGEESGIWIMNADGSAKKRLHFSADAEFLAVSAGGKKLAYAEPRGRGYDPDWYTYYVSDMDGSSRSEIADGYRWGLYLSFSPDGEKVLCNAYDGFYVANADGSGRKKLALAWYRAYSPVFLGDGGEIAYIGCRLPGSAHNVYTMDVEGSNVTAFKATEGMDVRDLVVSPAGDRLLFEGGYYGGLYDDYFVVDADGSGLARLTASHSEYYYPYGATSSADGSKIVYLSNETADYHIYTANADGSAKVRFDLKGGLWGDPYLSPDGKKVAFVNYYEFFRNGNIFLVDVDGTNLTQVTAYGYDAEITDNPDRGVGVLDERLKFSGDGHKILYCSAEFGSKDIFAVDVDGTGKTRLTDSLELEEAGPAFIPGGDEIIFDARGSGEKSGIWIMNADGTAKNRLPLPVNAFEWVALSADGKKIAYTERNINEYGAYDHSTYVANLDGSGRFKVADVRSASLGLSFSPDGEKVLYHLYGGVYVVNADGLARKMLITPERFSVTDVDFFAGGAKIAFVGRSQTDPGYNIYTMEADGANVEPFKATEGMHIRSLTVLPKGDRFILRGGYEGNAPVDYFAVNADGTGLVRLTGE